MGCGWDVGGMQGSGSLVQQYSCVLGGWVAGWLSEGCNCFDVHEPAVSCCMQQCAGLQGGVLLALAP